MCLPVTTRPLSAALLQKYLDSYDLSIRVVYVLGTLGFSLGTAVMAMFANVYVAMIMISTYALLGQYHDIREVGGRALEGRPRHELASCGRLCSSHWRFLRGAFLPTSSLALMPSPVVCLGYRACVWSRVNQNFMVPPSKDVT